MWLHFEILLNAFARPWAPFFGDLGPNWAPWDVHWTFFGDPSVELRTAPPTNMLVAHDDIIVLGTSDFIVDVGFDGALAALSQNGELIASAYSENGIVILDIASAASMPGEFDLVVTGFNSYPYETTVMVLSPDGPFLMIENSL